MFNAGWKLPAIAGMMMGLCAGCATGERARPKIIELAAFASGNTQGQTTRPEGDPAPPVAAEQPGNPDRDAAKPAPTVIIAAEDLEPGQPVIIDQLIGQVSGRPIFVDALLDPLADQIRQEARRRRPEDFNRWVQQRVVDRLQEVILNELLLAEAEAALTEQQQQGLLAFLRDFQEKKLAEERGSRSQLERELQLEGITPEQLLEFKKNEVLLQNLLSERIAPRVIVSWKEVEREYERRKGEFNPPARVTLKRIRLENESQAEQIAQVKARLAAGDDFSAIAKDVGMPHDGQWDTFPVGPGGVSDIADLNEAYLAAMKGLQEGQTTEPIEVSGRTQWIHIAKLEQPPPKSLYDVQREIHRDLRVRREREERERYLRTLFDKGIYSEVNEMAQRVVEVALRRYGQQT